MKKKTTLKRKPLAKVSDKRKKEMREYAKLRKEFLGKHPYCQVWLKEHGFDEVQFRALGKRGLLASDIHHVEKRGKNYLNTDTWLAVSRKYHEQIHNNPKWAREKGYLK